MNGPGVSDRTRDRMLERLRNAQRAGLTARVELVGADERRITGLVTSVSATGAFVVVGGVMLPVDRIHKVRMVEPASGPDPDTRTGS